MIKRIRKFTIKHRLIIYTFALLFIGIFITGLVSYELAKDGLNRRGETILKNGVKSALAIIEQKQYDVQMGYIELEVAQEQVKELLLGPMQMDGTRPIEGPIDLGKHGYFIIYSTAGDEIMHPFLEGENVWDVVDLNPRGGDFYLVQDKIEKALDGGGFTKYSWSVRNDDEIRDKIVYSEYESDWGWVVTAGSYMKDFNEEANIILGVTLSISIIMIMIGCLVSYKYIESITRPLIRLEKTMELAKRGNYITIDPLKRQDEIGNLILGYNSMIMAIKSGIERLKEKDEVLYNYAYFDTTTSLPNKLFFKELIEERLKVCDKICQLVLMDIKDFRSINSIYGGDYGDFILKQIAEILKEYENDSIKFARLSGNEFGAWLEGYDNKEAANMIYLLKKFLSKKLSIGGGHHYIEFYFSCSGDMIRPSSFEEYYQNASVALKHAKDLNDMNLLCFQEDMYRKLERSALIKDLAEQAIKRDEFIIHYQKKVDINKKEIVGVEALTRWNSKELGNIPPSEFIPLINNTSLIYSFTEYIMLKAFDELPTIQERFGDEVTVSINIPPNIFYMKSFEEGLKKGIRARGINPKYICLEITEDVFIRDFRKVQTIIKNLREFGVKISLDDFGTGYSSLNYISKFSLDEIKIDKQFIDSIHIDPKTQLLLKSIIDIAKGFEYIVVAEGVESNEQIEALKAIDCSIVQGYIFSRPEPLINTKCIF